MNILFIKLGALGDVINTLPLAIALKEDPEVHIHWLVAPLSYPLISNHPSVDKTILFDKNNLSNSFKKVYQELKNFKYDIVLDLQRTLKSGLFTMLAKSNRKIGFDKKRCKEMTWLFPFERIEPNNPDAHMLDQYLEFGKHLGINKILPSWNIPVFGKKPEILPEKYIVLNTGATKAANKWLPESFAKLSDMIFQSKKIKCVLTGGPEDIPFSDKIVTLSESKPLNLTGKTSIGELSETIKHSIITISCDTGPMHLAVAHSTDIIALFGPSNPKRTGPYKGSVIKKTINCSPCNKKKCVEPECMKLIMPDDVFKQIEFFI